MQKVGESIQSSEETTYVAEARNYGSARWEEGSVGK
jgi:hypothetical protein